MSAKEILEQYQFGLARSPKDIPNLVEIFTGKVKKRYPNYWPTLFRSNDADFANKVTETTEINNGAHGGDES